MPAPKFLIRICNIKKKSEHLVCHVIVWILSIVEMTSLQEMTLLSRREVFKNREIIIVNHIDKEHRNNPIVVCSYKLETFKIFTVLVQAIDTNN